MRNPSPGVATLKRAFVVGILALAMGFAFSERQVDTYYDDTHYSFTYYMARTCGYTPDQAHRLASANASVDYSPFTEPVQSFGVTDAAQGPRVRFHAFRDARLYSGTEKNLADRAIQGQARALWQLGRDTTNPGVFLHFLQDQAPHAGYASGLGHWGADVPGILNPGGGIAGATASDRIGANALADPDLPWGATTDFLSYNSFRANEMIDRTFAALTRFMSEASPGVQRPRGCAVGDMRQVLAALIRGNPLPPTLSQYLSQRPGSLERGTPDVAAVNSVIRQSLNRQQEVQAYHEQRIEYVYDAAGRPIGENALPSLDPLDRFVLYGALQIRLQQAGANQGPVKVSVWAPPTRRGERPYQLDCKTSAVVSPIQRQDLLFENLPVGDVIVQTVAPGGTVTRETLELDRRELSLVIDVPAETERSRQCGEQVANAARALCSATRSGVQSRNLSDVQSLEQRFDQQFTEYRSCLESPLTENTPAGVEIAFGAAEPPPEEAGDAANPADIILPLALAGGAGLGALLVLDELDLLGGACTPPNPSPGQVCFGSSRNASACNSAISQQDAFCRCEGFSGFNVSTGGCQ